MTHIVQLLGDDWTALYFDGQRVDQGYSIPSWLFARHLLSDGGRVESYEICDITSFGWSYEDACDFPQTLDLDEYRKGPQ